MAAVPRTLNVIGAGRLGRALAALWSSTGQVQVVDVLTTNPETAQAAVRFIGEGRAVSKLEELRPAQFTLVATPDAAIPRIAKGLHKHQLIPPNGIVFHTSPTQTAEHFLGPLAAHGACIASIHPLQRFGSAAEAVELFANTPVSVEGNQYAVKQLFRLFKGIGARTYQIEPQNKVLGDVATVLASAGLISTVEAALQVLVQSGMRQPDAIKALRPLLVRTLNNVFDLNSTGAAMTGPVAEGDVRAAKLHLEALNQSAEHVADLYKALGGFAVDAVDALADQYKPSEDALDELVDLFRIEKAEPEVEEDVEGVDEDGVEENGEEEDAEASDSSSSSSSSEDAEAEESEQEQEKRS